MSNHPPFTDIDSSVLSGHHYDPATSTLHLRFNNGKVWRYEDVPMEKATSLAGNASPGRYFGEKIRGLYKGREV